MDEFGIIHKKMHIAAATIVLRIQGTGYATPELSAKYAHSEE
jgi:hypothetical protein